MTVSGPSQMGQLAGCHTARIAVEWRRVVAGVSDGRGDGGDPIVTVMDIHISKESDVPIRQQLAEQIVFLIASEKLKPGQPLPSVRELARRLKIHHNTVSHAYQDLVRRTWLVSRRGSRVLVRSHADILRKGAAESVDELINMTIQVARERGFSLQTLRERFRERLLTEPPDHILVVDQEPGLRRLVEAELQEALRWPAESCAREDLVANPGLIIGALVVVPQYGLEDVRPLVPSAHLIVPIGFNSADEHIERIRKLEHPSVIGVVSVSHGFLKTAVSLLASAVGRKHTICQALLPQDSADAVRAADIVFCDSVAHRQIKGSKVVHYRLIAPSSLEYLSSAIASYQKA
jgi:DNA-binding transcriptional regulator YhcF (GntR family)